MKEEKQIKNCEGCGIEFTFRSKHQRFCNKTCAGNAWRTLYGPPKNPINQSTTGAISELLVCSDLMKRGYSVFRSMSPSSYVDMVAIKGDTILKIEVRTGTYSIKGNLQYATNNTTGKCIVVVTRSDDKIHYVSGLK